MNYLNKIEIIGKVGSIRILPGATTQARIAVCTEEALSNADGETIYEMTWHCVNAINKDGIPDFDDIKVGQWIHVIGRMKSHAYIDAEGVEQRTNQIRADLIEIL